MSKDINTVRITIRPSLHCNKTRRHNSRGPLYDAVHEGKVIVTNSTEPGFDGARVLKAKGILGQLEVWDELLPYCRFRFDVETAADLTVREGGGRPRFRKFKPFAPHQGLDSFSMSMGTGIAPTLKKPPTETCATITDQSPEVKNSSLLSSPAWTKSSRQRGRTPE